MSDGALTQRRSLSVEHGHLVRGGAPINADVRRIGGLGHRASFPPPAAPWCLVVPCTGAGSAIPHWTSTTIRPTGARLRVRCLRARGSSGAPSETADFKRSNGTGFESRREGPKEVRSSLRRQSFSSDSKREVIAPALDRTRRGFAPATRQLREAESRMRGAGGDEGIAHRLVKDRGPFFR